MKPRVFKAGRTSTGHGSGLELQVSGFPSFFSKCIVVSSFSIAGRLWTLVYKTMEVHCYRLL